ncbi:hypothetical protein B0H11DRAFT_1917471 [Mycena galericulata]|nr:hypothetical protein B0H11DRAFT_1917471 [Mycena galericulata]
MQLFSKLFLYLVATAVTAHAGAVSVDIRGANSIQPEALPAGTACTGPDLTGDCTTFTVSSIPSPCTNFPSGFSSAATTLLLNEGIVCTFYVTEKCGGAGGWVVVFPDGIADFTNTDYDQTLTCYICDSEDGFHPFTWLLLTGSPLAT